MDIYTIGFTKRSAQDFFESLRKRGIQRLVDVRVNNTSQLAGFAKKRDLVYFLQEMVGAEYHHELLLAPDKALLKRYRTKELTWDQYETAFVNLLSERKIEDAISRDFFSPRTVLLCSEPTPAFCHRRLVVEYLNGTWGDVQAVDL